MMLRRPPTISRLTTMPDQEGNTTPPGQTSAEVTPDAPQAESSKILAAKVGQATDGPAEIASQLENSNSSGAVQPKTTTSAASTAADQPKFPDAASLVYEKFQPTSSSDDEDDHSEGSSKGGENAEDHTSNEPSSALNLLGTTASAGESAAAPSTPTRDSGPSNSSNRSDDDMSTGANENFIATQYMTGIIMPNPSEKKRGDPDISSGATQLSELTPPIKNHSNGMDPEKNTTEVSSPPRSAVWQNKPEPSSPSNKSTVASESDSNATEEESKTWSSSSSWRGCVSRNYKLVFCLAFIVLAIIFGLAFFFVAMQNQEDEMSPIPGCVDCESEDEPVNVATPVPTISLGPTGRPSISGAPSQSAAPTLRPTRRPTGVPSRSPSEMPSVKPTRNPTGAPTRSYAPSESPSMEPTNVPSESPSMEPTNVPSAPPSLSPAGKLRGLLEEKDVTLGKTLEAIDVAGTPQQRAFEWLSNDPNFLNYRDFRKTQRFALGTLYYSISQPQEVRESLQTWMQYETNECAWFTSWFENRVGCGSDNIFKFLTLRNINLVGTIPAELAMLTRLESLVLEENGLQGTIPIEFGNWKSLQNLDLGKNFLEGPLPEFNATNLKRIDLSWNQLTGTIPDGIRGLPQLEYVDFTENFLWGSVPNELCLQRRNISLGVDCSEVSCGCCDKCGSEETRFPVAIAPVAPTPPPTPFPTPAPTPPPTAMPSAAPSRAPTSTPSSMPTGSPSSTPSARPTGDPSLAPTQFPTLPPTPPPTAIPSAAPSRAPTRTPSSMPTGSPSSTPSARPTGTPSPPPTIAPTRTPTPPPTPGPTKAPTPPPTGIPTPPPTRPPTPRPTPRPTMSPTPCPDANIQATKNCFQYGEPIVISFNNCNPTGESWVGIYPDNLVAGQHATPLLWKNACDSQSCLDTIGSGTVTMDAGSAGISSWPLEEGQYKAWIFNEWSADDGPNPAIVGSSIFFIGFGQC